MLESIRVGSGASGIAVFGAFADRSGVPGSRDLPKGQRDALEAARTRPGFKADPGEIREAGDEALLVGLGKAAELKQRTLRTVGARLIRHFDRVGARAATLRLERSIETIEPAWVGRCIGEGAGLANWRVDFFGGSASRTEAARAGVTLNAASPDLRGGLELGLTLAECTNYARRLAATPPNICNPTWIAAEAQRLARETGLRCTVIREAEARRLGLGGLLNVGRASASGPCLVILEHRPRRVSTAARGQRLALVGKTITYDTGGYSLKISNGMKGMKYDKNGGMAVLGAMRAIATLDLPLPVVALLPAAENMVGGDAYRPDDIITLFNGVSVEVTNTDAEGRLVLADALAYACRKLRPTAIVDVATLTGGVVVALGSWCAGMFCNDDALRERVERAAERTGEAVWRLPLWEQHRDFMRAKHADIWNSGPKRDGHPLQGAAFLSYFVDNGIPWAHLDIAGVSAVDGDDDLFVAGPTGWGVRLLTELAADFAR